ncbi:hypothetical protein [Nostoc sp. LEGE 06077]|uniref:hypothetical protein n=1 Tax=Nostoc sp. LEGE 06077 TaxID=915325 RepID=UPI00187FA5F7|nr:hypothetical protein [Nostoc sp. LEGE 06077]
MQSELAGKELDFALHLAACEYEIKSGISVTFEPMPEPETQAQQQANSIYNLNDILDAFEA